MIIELERLLIDGMLNGVEFGQTPDKIEDLFGRPDAIGKISIRSVIYKYFNVQFHFTDLALRLIEIDCYKVNSLYVSVEYFINIMNKINIGFSIFKKYSFDDQICYKTENGNLLIFDTKTQRLEKWVIEPI